MSKIEVNQISSQCGSTLTIGQSGDTVTLACGATAAGFGSTGEVSWDTTKKTSGFTAVSGVGYFCDTTSAAFTVTLPATPSAGNVVAVSDYNGTAGTNVITIGRNGSNINGSASDFVISKNNSSVQFIYIDATVGWQTVFTGNTTDAENPFIVATGGTVTCCGDYKIHTFTGPGTFTVTNAGTPAGSNSVDYLVVAGGGSGGNSEGGGGGAGGYRESHCATTSGCYTASPLATPTSLPIAATSYPITVGGGGAGYPYPQSPAYGGNNGSNSIFSTITSTGGGAGGTYTPATGTTDNGNPGGSGGGAKRDNGSPTGKGAGNTPPVAPPQGNPGGTSPGSGWYGGGGGGGAGSAGGNSSGNGTPAGEVAGPGGNGTASSITASPVTRAGGGGSSMGSPSGSVGTGGPGGGGTGSSGPGNPAGAGTANTGGGGGGGQEAPGGGGSGGSGIVIIRYKYK